MPGALRVADLDDGDLADVLLKGTITGFGLTPVAFDEQGRATQYQVNVRAKIELVDRRGDEPKVLWKNDQYYFAEDYSISPEEIDSFDQETRSIRQIAVRFAESLVSSVSKDSEGRSPRPASA